MCGCGCRAWEMGMGHDDTFYRFPAWQQRHYGDVPPNPNYVGRASLQLSCLTGIFLACLFSDCWRKQVKPLR